MAHGHNGVPGHPAPEPVVKVAEHAYGRVRSHYSVVSHAKEVLVKRFIAK